MSARFEGLDFAGFRELARDPTLSRHEKVGFPDCYRAGKEAAILRDVTAKLTNFRKRGRLVVDIGAGCGALASALIKMCDERDHRLVLVDSSEMLALLPDAPFIEKVCGRFPEECTDLLARTAGRAEAVLAYSVTQYVFVERSVFDFLDRALELLAPGGQLLLGDIPNRSMRNRFFSSAAGASVHRQFAGGVEPAPGDDKPASRGRIDDSVVLALLARARAGGFHAYVMPQRPGLPMANRREDILIVRP